MQTRRAFFRSIPVAAAAALIGCRRFGFFQPVLSDSAIDVHAHIFNGRDLPIVGFLTTTVLRDPHAPVDPDMTSDPFLHLLKGIMLSGTPSAREELGRIGTQPVSAVAARSAEELAQQDEANVARGVAAFYAEASNGAGLVDEDTQRLNDRLFDEVGMGLDDAELVDPDEIPGRIASRIYERTQRGDRVDYTRTTPFVQTLRWAGLLTRSRSDILTELVRLYGGEERIRVFSPSLVDFVSWYPRREKISPLSDQINVMSAIAQQRQDAVLLNFAPFCPLRAALEREDVPGRDPLFRVQDAVMNKGFAGVKLYPPVGFKPLKNEGISFQSVARAPAEGAAAIDWELHALYRWCNDNGVPIKAHANNSIGRGECTALYASPENWRPVLETYSDLRINLAHFGGFDETDPDNDECKPDDPRDWEALTAELVRDFENIYLDVGFWTDVVRETPGREARLKATRNLLREVPRIADRIMYGSDWSMIGRVVGHETYLAEIQLAAVEIGFDDTELAKFESENAQRFMGLAPGDPQFDRLSAFFGPDHLFTQLFGA